MIGATPAMHFNMIESDGEALRPVRLLDMGEAYPNTWPVAPCICGTSKIGQQVLEHVRPRCPESGCSKWSRPRDA